MKDDISRALIALQLVPNLGPAKIKKLLQRVTKPEQIFGLNYHQMMRVEGIGETIAQNILTFDEWERVDEIEARTKTIGAQLISFYDHAYPEHLRQIYDAPLLLWVQGNLKALSEPSIAIVGTRNPSDYGRAMAREFAQQAVKSGLVVNSGLAYGIDTIAHQTVVNQKGKTVAVLGSGIDIIYPSQNFQLANEIMEQGGAIISEFPPGAKPDAGNFPARNRIVSGLSLGVLVVETKIKGGSRITASMALDQNREVFVIPHPLTVSSGMGCNDLIKRGLGKLVQSFDDVLDELELLNQDVLHDPNHIPIQAADHWSTHSLSPTQEAICSAIESGITHIDDLASKIERPIHECLVTLLELEFEHIVIQKAGKHFLLK